MDCTPDNVMKFDLSSKQIKFKDILDKEFVELEVYAISDANPNRNGSHFTLESMEKVVKNGSLKNKPIVGFFEKGDFTTHEGKVGYDMELQKPYWETLNGERILGWIRESDNVEIVEKDGLHWIKFTCILCVNYCYTQVKRLLKDRKKKVSVEITVNEKEINGDIIDILDFTLNGTTILGSKNGRMVKEGIAGAHATILDSLDGDAFQEQRKVLSFAYKQIDGNADEDGMGQNTDPETNLEGEEDNVMAEEQNKAEGAILENENVTESFSENNCEGNEELPVAEEGENLEMGEGEATEGEEPKEPVANCDDNCADCNNDCGEGEGEENGENNAPEGEEDGDNGGEPAPENECEKFAERIAELEAKCEEYCATIAKLEEEHNNAISEYNAKLSEYADYFEIKERMETAEKKVHEYFCAGLRATAESLMAGERVSKSDYDAILGKCSAGEYSNEDSIKHDIAYAIYSARTSVERQFSFPVNAHEAGNIINKSGEEPMTREQRIASRRKK